MMRRFGICLAASVAAVALNGSVAAHKTVVSPYTYHRDVLPIIEARCGRCHGDGNPSGLSLLRYDSARAATWPLRQQLIRGHMPPWFAEGPFKAPVPLTARELNVLMTWATGGAPEGAAVTRQRSPSSASWLFGPPDLIVPMAAEFRFAETETERVHEVSLPARINGRMIRAVDLLPGTPQIVRRAEIVARSGTREQVLGLWQPGEPPARLEANAAFEPPSNSSLLLRIHYRRHYGDPASDRSRVGIYFGDRSSEAMQSIELRAEAGSRTEQRIDRGLRLIALRPISGPSGAWIQLTVIDAAGTKNTLARIQMQSEWPRRYVFESAIAVQPGNKIEISVTPSGASLWSSLTGDRIDPAGAARIALEFVN